MYIGERKVYNTDWTTVFFKDGSQKEYTHKQLSYIITKKPKDLTEYRNLVLDVIFQEIDLVINDEDAAEKILWIIEEHDLTNSEVAAVFSRIIPRRTEAYRTLVDERVKDIKEAYDKDMKHLEEVAKIVGESYTMFIHKAFSKALWTYEDNKHPETCVDNIRISDMKRVISE